MVSLTELLPNKIYYLHTPQFEVGAADVLMKALMEASEENVINEQILHSPLSIYAFDKYSIRTKAHIQSR